MCVFLLCPARRCSQTFQLFKVSHGICPAGAAHLRGWLQRGAYCRTFRGAEYGTAHIGVQMDTGDSGGFALRHPRYGGAYGWGNTAGSAKGSAFTEPGF